MFADRVCDREQDFMCDNSTCFQWDRVCNLATDCLNGNDERPGLCGKMLLLLFNTVLVIIKLTKFAVALRLSCGSCKLIFFYIISSFFAKFKNVVHSLEPGETPSYVP